MYQVYKIKTYTERGSKPSRGEKREKKRRENTRCVAKPKSNQTRPIRREWTRDKKKNADPNELLSRSNEGCAHAPQWGLVGMEAQPNVRRLLRSYNNKLRTPESDAGSAPRLRLTLASSVLYCSSLKAVSR